MNLLILVNPLAGNNRGSIWLAALRERIDRSDLGLSVEPTRKGQVLDQLQRLGRGKDRVLVVGGDGTVREVLDAVSQLESSLPIGIVPLGTGNDLARSLGLYRGRPWRYEEALAYALSPGTTPVDIWSVNGGLTFNNYLSAGLDAWIVRRFCRLRNWMQAHPQLGKRGIYFTLYILVWLAHLGRRVPLGSTLTWVDGGGARRKISLGEARVLAITNTPYYAAGALMDPEARVGDGILEVTLFGHMRQYVELMAMRLPWMAHREIQARWWRIRAKGVEIDLPSPRCVQADGEDVTDLLGEEPSLVVTRRGQVEVLVANDPLR